jgi:3-oxoacyl-[acyl-carrier-protein] synthase II
MNNRVVITGMGMLSALGHQEDAVFANLLQGKTGIRPLTLFNPEKYKTKVGAEIDTATIKGLLAEHKLSSSERVIDLAMIVASIALGQAGVRTAPPPYVPLPIGVIFGTGAGPILATAASLENFFTKGPVGVRPTSVVRCMLNVISAQISMQFALTGPNYVTVSACSSATNAIGIAFRMVRHGYADLMLCGGAEAIFEPGTFASWDNMGPMSRNPDPLTACRPFDAKRDGCILGEGAGAFVIESLESAQKRGAKIRGEILGYGESSDAGHITRPNPDGQATAIQQAVKDAEIDLKEIGCISAHGTGTSLNDSSESQAIIKALGEQSQKVITFSSKAHVGHTLGAAGVVEMALALLGLEHGVALPNLNLTEPDAACPIRLAGATAMPLEAPVCVKNSFGFGGNNGVLVFRAWK